MLLHIPGVLTKEQVAEFRGHLGMADWVDGRATAGNLSLDVKNNQQVATAHPIARRLGEAILIALERNPLFVTAALPLKIVPPLFNRYRGGETYGNHVDGAVYSIAGTPHRVRTDLSATLFLSEPGTYTGGDLVIEDPSGTHRVKLPAGDMILYAGTSVPRVEPVVAGERLASFFWVQSMVRDDGARGLLLELDTAIRQLRATMTDPQGVVPLINIYHNLLRRWSDT